jgi:hypothetical protein
MKSLSAVFAACVAGIVVCLGMTIYKGIEEHREKNTPQPITIPLPAISQ